MSGWETLDVETLMNRREEQTTSAGVGSYPVPLGRPMRRKFPVSAPQYKTLDNDLTKAEASSDAEYQWALGMIRSGY